MKQPRPPSASKPAAASAKRCSPGWKRYVSITRVPTPASLDGVDDALRAREVVGERLLEQHRFPGRGGAHREVGLRVGRDRDRDRVARREQRVDVGRTPRRRGP